MQDICEQLRAAENFDEVQWLNLDTPKTLERYETWLNNEFHGDMEYLRRHQTAKADPQTQWPRVQSVVMVTKTYIPASEPQHPFPGLRLALYAQSKDYHEWLQAMLDRTALQLKMQFPDEIFFASTDSKPFLEREYAARAGLGWIGKNTCLIHPKRGSFSLIGEILTTMKIDDNLREKIKTPTLLPNFCGTCTRCLDACPTQALSDQGLDARKCISYWTIEAKKNPPLEIRQKIGDWFFGCDICQSVCPWNDKPFRKLIDFQNASLRENFDRELATQDLIFIFSASDQDIKNRIANSALSRAKVRGLKRNALVLAGNLKWRELKSHVERYSCDPDLGELAAWALGNA